MFEMPGSRHIWPQHDIFDILICCGTFASPCHSFYIVPHARMRWKLKCLSQPPIIMSMVVGITDFSCPCSGLTVNDIDGVADFRSRSARKYRNVTKPLFHLQKNQRCFDHRAHVEKIHLNCFVLVCEDRDKWIPCSLIPTIHYLKVFVLCVSNCKFFYLLKKCYQEKSSQKISNHIIFPSRADTYTLR